jgi:hypothetical protein
MRFREAGVCGQRLAFWCHPGLCGQSLGFPDDVHEVFVLFACHVFFSFL